MKGLIATTMTFAALLCTATAAQAGPMWATGGLEGSHLILLEGVRKPYIASGELTITGETEGVTCKYSNIIGQIENPFTRENTPQNPGRFTMAHNYAFGCTQTGAAKICYGLTPFVVVTEYGEEFVNVWREAEWSESGVLTSDLAGKGKHASRVALTYTIECLSEGVDLLNIPLTGTWGTIVTNGSPSTGPMQWLSAVGNKENVLTDAATKQTFYESGEWHVTSPMMEDLQAKEEGP